MLGYLQLLRPGNCVMGAIAALIGALMVINFSEFIYFSPVYIAMIIVFLITGAGNTINDCVDVDADKINKPSRPIVSKRVSKRSALIYAIVLFAIGIFLSGLINWYTLTIAVINSILLILYPLYLKRKLLVGNVVISYLVGSVFLFGGAAFANLTLPFLLFLLAFFANISREIVKDLEDIEGDRKSFLRKLADVKKGIKKIAERFGITKGKVELKHTKKLLSVAAFSLILAISISPLPYILNLLSFTYLVLLVPTDAVFLFCIYQIARVRKRKNYGRISKNIKIGMFIGLLAFIVGVLF